MHISHENNFPWLTMYQNALVMLYLVNMSIILHAGTNMYQHLILDIWHSLCYFKLLFPDLGIFIVNLQFFLLQLSINLVHPSCFLCVLGLLLLGNTWLILKVNWWVLIIVVWISKLHLLLVGLISLFLEVMCIYTKKYLDPRTKMESGNI